VRKKENWSNDLLINSHNERERPNDQRKMQESNSLALHLGALANAQSASIARKLSVAFMFHIALK